MLYLIFDTETTGLPKNYKAPVSDSENWPRAVQLSWQLHDHEGKLIDQKDFLIKPDGFDIPFQSERVHGISTALALKEGHELYGVLKAFEEVVLKTDFVVGQNIDFDLNIMGAEFYRIGVSTALLDKKVLDTCTEKTANFCQLSGGRGGRFKLPTLSELHRKLFRAEFAEAHNASADVEATARCFFELIRIGQFDATSLGVSEELLQNFKVTNPNPIQAIGLKHKNLKAASEKLAAQNFESAETKKTTIDIEEINQLSFAHLHSHSQFSILQATMKPAELVETAAELEMPGVALTDTGNMMGAFSFVSAVAAHNKSNPENPIKGIVGCELAMVENRHNKELKDLGYPVVLLGQKQNRISQLD
jgi:DNA polymerase-3 subunit alpha